MSGTPRQITVDAFVAEAKQRFGDDPQKWVFVCPACGTRQTAEDFCRTGQFVPGSGELNGVLGFSCIGRFTGQGADGITAHNQGRAWVNGCDWTLGGLLRIHDVELIDADGVPHPHFDLAPGPNVSGA